MNSEKPTEKKKTLNVVFLLSVSFEVLVYKIHFKHICISNLKSFPSGKMEQKYWRFILDECSL